MEGVRVYKMWDTDLGLDPEQNNTDGYFFSR